MEERLKTLKDLVGIEDDGDFGKNVEDCLFSGELLKSEAVKRAKFYKSQAFKFSGKEGIDYYGNYCYFKGKFEAEIFAHNLTEEDFKEEGKDERT
jgi:hypothetical protein